MSIYCIHCSSPTTNPKFCSRSCAASHNNIGKRRHGQQKNECLVCKKQTSSARHKYCSSKCWAIPRKKSVEEKRAYNAYHQSKYRQKRYRDIHPTANPKIIKEIYLHRPEGYEVDHIVPVSKGGLHHQDNLQYLPKEVNRKKSNKLVADVGSAPTPLVYETNDLSNLSYPHNLP